MDAVKAYNNVSYMDNSMEQLEEEIKDVYQES